VIRREFLTAAAAVALASRPSGAQEQEARKTMSGPMDENRYRPVALPAKTNAGAAMSEEARDALEHHIHCQCGCTLDVYTCRTTDFTCPVSPAMHGDVVKLATAGYSSDEILNAFTAVYGERVRMTPLRTGFNWAGYLAPFLAVGAGGLALAAVMVRWQRAAVAAHADGPAALTTEAPADATPEELTRLDAELRDDTR
jgi:cytochrome c-type biogenesis protein CcmH